jgi:hypothetical protein
MLTIASFCDVNEVFTMIRDPRLQCTFLSRVKFLVFSPTRKFAQDFGVFPLSTTELPATGNTHSFTDIFIDRFKGSYQVQLLEIYRKAVSFSLFTRTW